MREHKKPADGSGYERLPKQAHRLPPGTLDHAWYGLMSGWKAVVVGSSLEDHGAGKLVHHPGYAHHFWMLANPQGVN